MSLRLVDLVEPHPPRLAAPRPGAAIEQEEAGESSAFPSGRLLGDGLLLVGGLSWGAGLIHVQAAITHWNEYMLYSVFFALLAAAQLAWGVALCTVRVRALLAAGAALNLCVIVLWIVSRTIGVPLGANQWRPEPVGVIDSLATADEFVLAVLVALRLHRQHTGVLYRSLQRLAQATAVCLVLLSSLAVTLPPHGD